MCWRFFAFPDDLVDLHWSISVAFTWIAMPIQSDPSDLVGQGLFGLFLCLVFGALGLLLLVVFFVFLRDFDTCK